MVYAASKIADYDDRIKSLLPVVSHPDLLAKGITIEDITKELAQGKYEKFNEAATIISQIADTNKDEVGEALNDIAEMSLRRDKFFKEYEEMKSSPEKWIDKETRIPTEEEINKPPADEEYVELDTAKGKKKLTVGETYFLGSVVDYDKNGLEKPIEIHEFKILKDNGDTVDVITNKGEVKTVSKSAFKNYHLGSLSAIKDDDNANYFYHHRNDKFEFNFGKGKDGKQRLVQGRVEYKDGKLFFVYAKYIDRKTKKPVIGRIEVKREQFFAQDGFKQAMIKRIGGVRTKEQEDAHNRLVDEKKRKEENKRLEESSRARNNLLAELFVELSEKQKSVKELIEKKKAELKNIIVGLDLLREDIENVESLNKTVKKGIKFKKHAKEYLQASSRLIKMKDDIEWEIETLERQKEDIEIALAYVEDTSHYIYETSPDIEQFYEEIKEQIFNLEEAVESNNLQINALHRLITKIENAISKIVAGLNDLVEQFTHVFQKTERGPVVSGEWLTYMEEHPDFLKNPSRFKSDIETISDLIYETEDIEITPKRQLIDKAKESIEELEQEIKEIEPELIGLRSILDKFKPYVEKVRQKRKEEEKLSKDSPTLDNESKSNKAGIRNADLNKHDKEYEPEKKKADKLVVTSTITTDDGKDHQKRSNTFGQNLNKFENRDKIRGVYITSKNERLLIPGLIDFLLPKDDSIDRDTVIALVMVEVDEKTGRISLVGMDGKPLKEGDNPLDKGVFQVFPEKDLRWSEKYGGGSMFRNTLPKKCRHP